jgi:ABC-type microcin C transport system duplicated ATPase subunit YejF
MKLMSATGSARRRSQAETAGTDKVLLEGARTSTTRFAVKGGLSCGARSRNVHAVEDVSLTLNAGPDA